MFTNDIKKFKNKKESAKLDLSYIISSNIYDVKDENDLDNLLNNLNKLMQVIPQVESIYVIDTNGIQITNTISIHKNLNAQNKGSNKSNRSFFYETKKERTCQISNPYLYQNGESLAVTISYPVFDVQKNLLAIICMEISLKNLLKITKPNSLTAIFNNSSKIIYSIFTMTLFLVAVLLFVKAIDSFVSYGFDFEKIQINDIFKSTILLTLSLAIMDLLKAIFEEEVLGKKKSAKDENNHVTMVKFLGSIVIALSIESLMLVFKFALNDTSQIIYAVYLIFGVAVLLIALSYYLRGNKNSN